MSKFSSGRYLSSNGYETTTVASKEIIPPSPSNWTYGYIFKKFSFINETDCTVIINNEFTLHLIGGIGFEIDRNDVSIHSFVIVESGTRYYWIGAV